MERYALVSVIGAGPGAADEYTYVVPDELAGRVQVGCVVAVPFARRTLSGVVVGFEAERPPFELRPIADLIMEEPVVSPEQTELARWVARRYLAPLGEVLALMLPPGAAGRMRVTAAIVEGASAEQVRGQRQRQVLEALKEAGGEASADALLRRLKRGPWPDATGQKVLSALRKLEAKGLVKLQRTLRAARVRPLTRKVVEMADRAAAEAALAELSVRAPRQAGVVELLLEQGSAPASSLPAAAVQALSRKGIVRVVDALVQRRPDEALEGEASQFLRPTAEQAAAIDYVREAIRQRRHTEVLLFGVTGSGKTEVYLHCLREALAAGRGAIYLVPEIALTPQVLGRVMARFGEQVAILHSALSAGQRFDEWQRIRRGEARIVVGPRSAIFAPVADVGLVVVDEEHEGAYKQQSTPRYHAVEVARELARRHAAPIILGSATPSLESFHAAQAGQIKLFELPRRIDDRPMPKVYVVDLRKDPFIRMGRTFSEPLLEAMREALSRGEQVILFLNRRGFSTFVVCSECGWHARCPHCGVGLVYHHATRRMTCHWCAFKRPAPQRCDVCGSEDISFLGLGTERVLDRLQREFPDVSAARMDRDTVTRRTYRDVLAAFARGEIQVLVGTQMVAKGLDFPGVTLVGVLNADVGLAWPDFRAAERTFQLLCQVAGRAGRADRPGRVVIQTYSPDHPAVTSATRHDYLSFYAREIEERRKNLFPPFVHLARLVFEHREGGKAQASAQAAALLLEQMGVARDEGPIHYKGPAPAPLQKLRDRYRFHVLVKAQELDELLDAVDKLRRALKVPAEVVVDVDPVDML